MQELKIASKHRKRQRGDMELFGHNGNGLTELFLKSLLRLKMNYLKNHLKNHSNHSKNHTYLLHNKEDHPPDRKEHLPISFHSRHKWSTQGGSWCPLPSDSSDKKYFIVIFSHWFPLSTKDCGICQYQILLTKNYVFWQFRTFVVNKCPLISLCVKKYQDEWTECLKCIEILHHKNFQSWLSFWCLNFWEVLRY